MAQPKVQEGREAHPEVWEGSTSPLGGLGGAGKPTWRFGKPTQRSRRGREDHTEVREGLGSPPQVWEAHPEEW